MTAAAMWGGVLSSGDAATDPAVGMSGHRDGRRLGPEPLSSWSRPRRSPTAGAGRSNGGESAVGVAGRRVDRRGESCVDDGEGSRGTHQDRRGDLHRGRERDRSRRGPSRERVPSGGRRRGAGSDTSATIRRRSSSRGAHRSADRDRDGGDNGPRTKVLRLLFAIHKFALVDGALALQHAIEATSADVRALQVAAQRALLN